MKKLIILTVGLLSVSSFAEESNYGKCQSTINKIFTQSGEKSFFSKPVFTIDKFGRLVAQKEIAIKKYVEGEAEHIFRFNDKLAAKKKNKEFSYNVEKDEKGRVLSVEQTNCENCNTKVTFKYVKGNCVPEKVYSITDDKEEMLKADVELCRNVALLNTDKEKAFKKKQSCMKFLKGYEIELQGILGAFESRMDDENQSSKFVSDYNAAKITLTEIAKQVTLNDELSDIEVLHADSFSSILQSCKDSFSGNVLRINSVAFYENEDGIHKINEPANLQHKLKKSKKSKRVKKSKKVIP